MKSQRILQHKKIKNSPLKSPSPDYIPRNHNTKTTSPRPLQDSRIFRNTQMKPQTVSFPSLPLQLINKNKKIGVQNIQPVLSNLEKSIKFSTTLTKHQKHIDKQHTQTSQFVLYTQKSDDKLQQLFKLIEKIYGMISKRSDYFIKNQNKEINKIQKAFQYLQIIKQQVIRSTNKNYHTNDQVLLYQGQIKHSRINPSNVIDFLNIPKKSNQNIEDQDNYILKNHQLKSQNNRLRSQIVQLKQQLNKNFQQKQQRFSLINNFGQISQQNTNKNINQILLHRNQGQDINLTTFKFLRQKISYLQNELQNKIYKCQQLQKQKIQQKDCMKNSLTKKNQILQQQVKKYKNLVQIQKRKLIQLQQINKQMNKNDNILQQQIQNTQRIQGSKKKNLHWQKSQVLSIEDSRENNQEQQQSIITGKIKFNTQNKSFSSQDTHKYRNYLYHLHNQLENIKKSLQKCNNQLDISCLKCQQYQKLIISQTIEIIELSTQTKILKQQVQQQKFQNQKLRELIQKNIKLDINSSQASKKPKRKGFQKIQKKNLENNSSKKQFLDFQPSLYQIYNPKKLMTRSVIYGERVENFD